MPNMIHSLSDLRALDAVNAEIARAQSILLDNAQGKSDARSMKRRPIKETRKLQTQPGARGVEIATMPSMASMESAILTYDVFQVR